LFKHGGGAQPTTTPSASAPTTSAPSAPTSPASTPAPAPAPSAKTPASTPTPAKSPPKKASAPPKPSSPKPATAAGTPTPSQSQSPKPASTASSPPAGAAPAATPALDLTGLEQRLRETKAIGMFTKLSLKNQVDDLLTQFKAFHNKQAKLSQSDLRQRYDLLLLKVLSLLQDDDPSLASAISSSREAIWGILIDPVKFAKLS